MRRHVHDGRLATRSERDRFLDLDWAPGTAQADLGEADFRVRGAEAAMSCFVPGPPFPSVGLARVFPGESAECVCQGLRDAFECLSAVPARTVSDDAAGVGGRVCDVVRTTDLLAGCAAHHGFDCRFCSPCSGNGRGSVGNEAGTQRRNPFVPVPGVWDVAGYNALPLDGCVRMSDEEHHLRGEPGSRPFQGDPFAMSGLPAAPCPCARWAAPEADRRGGVRVDGRHRHSTGPSLAGLVPPVALGAAAVEARAPGGPLVRTHRPPCGKAPTGAPDPGSRLALPANGPGARGDSGVRAALPDGLREHMDSLERPRRSESTRPLGDRCAESGWDATVGAASGALAATGRVDGASAAAAPARSRSGAVACDEPVDPSAHDAATGAL